MTLSVPDFRQVYRLTVLLIWLASTVLVPTAGAEQHKYLVYVGTYTDHVSKGIYAYRFDPSTGKMTSLGLAAEAAEPSFLAVDGSGRFLYAVNEIANYNGQNAGSVSAFSIQPDTGKLSLLNHVSSQGKDPAHITLDRTASTRWFRITPRAASQFSPCSKTAGWERPHRSYSTKAPV